MNNRIINDLAVKSGLAEDIGRGYKFPNGYVEFAEFIVRECIAQCEKNSGHEYLGSGSKLSAFNIKQHFGIEE